MDLEKAYDGETIAETLEENEKSGIGPNLYNVTFPKELCK